MSSIIFHPSGDDAMIIFMQVNQTNPIRDTKIELPAYWRAGIHNNPILPKWKLAKLPEEYFSFKCFVL
jgi:hypothetical protein